MMPLALDALRTPQNLTLSLLTSYKVSSLFVAPEVRASLLISVLAVLGCSTENPGWLVHGEFNAEHQVEICPVTETPVNGQVSCAPLEIRPFPSETGDSIIMELGALTPRRAAVSGDGAIAVAIEERCAVLLSLPQRPTLALNVAGCGIGPSELLGVQALTFESDSVLQVYDARRREIVRYSFGGLEVSRLSVPVDGALRFGATFVFWDRTQLLASRISTPREEIRSNSAGLLVLLRENSVAHSYLPAPPAAIAENARFALNSFACVSAAGANGFTVGATQQFGSEFLVFTQQRHGGELTPRFVVRSRILRPFMSDLRRQGMVVPATGRVAAHCALGSTAFIRVSRRESAQKAETSEGELLMVDYRGPDFSFAIKARGLDAALLERVIAVTNTHIFFVAYGSSGNAMIVRRNLRDNPANAVGISDVNSRH